MDKLCKLQILGAAAKYDICAPSDSGRSLPQALPGVYRSQLPDRRCVSLLKVLMTNACINNCAYCVNRAGMDTPHTAFQPEELARLFMELYERSYVQGLFLSSGISPNASSAMESMLKAVEILRTRHHFGGYIHLKVLPGADFQYVERACYLADRISVNVEAPSEEYLRKLSPNKELTEGILRPMRWVKYLVEREPKLVPAGQTTQFVVGAAGETDYQIFSAVRRLYDQMHLHRVYFSAFQPIAGTPLEGRSPTSRLHQQHLYQLDWLYRAYHLAPHELELAFSENGNLPINLDPKVAIALRQRRIILWT